MQESEEEAEWVKKERKRKVIKGGHEGGAKGG